MSYICPWDGCESEHDTEWGMKIHHKKKHGESIAGIEVECDWCGSPVKKFESELELDDYNFCDKNCHDNWQEKNWNGESHPAWRSEEVECSHCGDILHRKPSQIREKDHHFCDRDCLGEWRSDNVSGENHPLWNGRIEVRCSNCSEPKKVPSFQARKYENHFCDGSCQGEWLEGRIAGDNHPNWKGGHEKSYGDNWNEERQRSLENANWKCERCGLDNGTHEKQNGRELDVHHCKPIRHFDELEAANYLDNLMALCQSCHMELEPYSEFSTRAV